MKDQAYKVIKDLNPQLCVLATCDENKAHAAVLAYVVREDLSVLLSTDMATKKWKNIEKNPGVSLVFGVGFTSANVQYDGTAQLVSGGEERKKLSEEFFSVHPELQRFNTPTHGFIVVTPNWVRLSDYTKTPPQVDEQTIS